MPEFKVTYTAKVTIVAEVDAETVEAAVEEVRQSDLEDLLEEHGLNNISDIKVET